MVRQNNHLGRLNVGLLWLRNAITDTDLEGIL
jgi:hypothetical protein